MVKLSGTKPYTLFQRNRVYYVQFRLPNGQRSVAINSNQSSRGAAESW
jgi:hypothetical protein